MAFRISIQCQAITKANDDLLCIWPSETNFAENFNQKYKKFNSGKYTRKCLQIVVCVTHDALTFDKSKRDTSYILNHWPEVSPNKMLALDNIPCPLADG